MSKVLTLLGFASKAGRLSFGMDTAVTSLKSGRSHLVVMGGNVSEKSQKEINFFAEKRNIPVVVLREFDIEAISKAVGKKCGIVSVDDSSFAEAIIKAHQEER